MHAIIAVKAFNQAKGRLATVLNSTQREKLSYLMLCDVLITLYKSDVIKEISIVSSEPSIAGLASKYDVNLIITDKDRGYTDDAMQAISQLEPDQDGTVAIIPSDVPQITTNDIRDLDDGHSLGLSVCPALMDGGTNAFVFDLPLTIPLLFGEDSLMKYRQTAEEKNVNISLLAIKGFERDIDRPDDLLWLKEQTQGGKAWSFIQNLNL